MISGVEFLGRFYVWIVFNLTMVITPVELSILRRNLITYADSGYRGTSRTLNERIGKIKGGQKSQRDRMQLKGYMIVRSRSYRKGLTGRQSVTALSKGCLRYIPYNIWGSCELRRRRLPLHAVLYSIKKYFFSITTPVWSRLSFKIKEHWVMRKH